MTVVAVAWLAFSLGPEDGQGTLAGTAVAAYTLPGAVGALMLGRWMRPLPARRLLATDAVVRAVLLGAIPLAYAAGVLSPVSYVLLLGGSSLLHAWGKAGRHALFVPMLFDGQRLAANSLLSSSMWIAMIAGPALAGVLVGIVSPVWIIGLDAGTFAVLALQTCRTELPSAPAAAAGGAWAGMRVMRRQPELLALLVVTWFFNFSFGPVEVVLPAFVSRDLGAGTGLLGTYWAAFGGGAVVGALGLGARRPSMWPTILAIIARHGLAMLPFAMAHRSMPSLVGFACAGLIYGPYSALSHTLLQDRAPAEALTTILAARSSVLLTASPLGAGLGGLLLDRAGARTVLVGCGLAMILIAVMSAALIIAATSVRRSRPAVAGASADRVVT